MHKLNKLYERIFFQSYIVLPNFKTDEKKKKNLMHPTILNWKILVKNELNWKILCKISKKSQICLYF